MRCCLAALRASSAASAGRLCSRSRSRNMQIWLRLSPPRVPARGKGPVHVMFCFVDHFEPKWGRADSGDAARARRPLVPRLPRAGLAPSRRGRTCRRSTASSIRKRNTSRSISTRSPRSAPTVTARSRSTCTTTTTPRRTSAQTIGALLPLLHDGTVRCRAIPATGELALRLHPWQLVPRQLARRMAAGAASTTS